MSLTKVSYSMITGAVVNVLDYGADSTGATDTAIAIQNAVAALPAAGGTVYFPSGTYLVGANTTFTDLDTVTFEGENQYSSIIKINSDNLVFKSPNQVNFIRLSFQGNTLASVQQSVWVSNYNLTSFIECYFSGFGTTSGTKPGSTCLFMYAGDVNDATRAAGSSFGGLLQNCVFEGDNRRTNFGVRVYTEFSGSTAENIDTRIEGCTLTGFNWNAVEIAGPNTMGVTVSNCVANLSGLVGFDIDKGAKNCTIQNVIINRLLGNADTGLFPNTGAAGVVISGVSDTGAYAENNLVDGVVIRLLDEDINAYQGRGVSAVAMAYAKTSTVRNIRMSCNALPVRPTTATYALAAISFTTCADITIENIETVNATVGVIEPFTFNQSVGLGPVRIRNIYNKGTMKGEVISLPNSIWANNQYLISDVSATTDMSDPIDAVKNSCIVTVNPNVGDGSAGSYVLKNIKIACTNATSYGIYPSAYRLAVYNVAIILNSEAQFFAAGGAMRRLFTSDLFCGSFGNTPLNVSSGFTNLASNCQVVLSTPSDPFPLPPVAGGGTLFSSVIPTNPLAAEWGQPAVLKSLTNTSGGYVGWANTSAGWKLYGAIL
jgi:hypothetical protein